MAIILVESIQSRERFYPLTLTRCIAELQCGIYTLKSWWEALTGEKVWVLSGDYLQEPLPADLEAENCYYIRSGLVPSSAFWKILKSWPSIKEGNNPENWLQSLFGKEQEGLLAFLSAPSHLDEAKQAEILDAFNPSVYKQSESTNPDQLTGTEVPYFLLDNPAQWLAYHGKVLEMQFEWLSQIRPSAPISATNCVLGADRIFIEPGAKVEFALLNGTTGPIYIGKDAEIMEGAMIRGPFALGAGSVVKMGAKIYGATTTEEKCTLGGEIKNVIFHKGSNKGHEGYLGDAMVGSWCNFGAGSGNSNVKNTASEVTVFDYRIQDFLPVGKKFGLMMGDYSRVAINSSINTGSSIGVSCNVFGTGLLPKYIAGFSWGVAGDNQLYMLPQAILHLRNWMAFKGEEPTDREIQILRLIFERARR